MAYVESKMINVTAQIKDQQSYQQNKRIAFELTGDNGIIYDQYDKFFKAAQGKLNMRLISNLCQKTKTLIYYCNNSEYLQCFTYKSVQMLGNDAATMDVILTQTNGALGSLHKFREVYFSKPLNTYIYLDYIHNLGFFLIFEIFLMPHQTQEEGTDIAKKLIATFNINTSDLVNETIFEEIINHNEMQN